MPGVLKEYRVRRKGAAFETAVIVDATNTGQAVRKAARLPDYRFNGVKPRDCEVQYVRRTPVSEAHAVAHELDEL